MVRQEKPHSEGKSIRIPLSQFKRIQQVIKKKGDFKSVAEYVRHCIREQLKRDNSDS